MEVGSAPYIFRVGREQLEGNGPEPASIHTDLGTDVDDAVPGNGTKTKPTVTKTGKRDRPARSFLITTEQFTPKGAACQSGLGKL